MRKMIIAILMGLLVQASLAAPVSGTDPNASLNRPVPLDYYRQFIAINNRNGLDSYQGFYWLDSTTGQLWEFDRYPTEWEDHGIQKGMKPGPNGTFLLLSDYRGGVYVLNTHTGQGWWFDGNRWEIINEEDASDRDKATKL